MNEDDINDFQFDIRELFDKVEKEIPLDLSIGNKDDDGKLRWDLMPIEAWEEAIRVFMFGAKKYDDNNYMKGMLLSRMYNAGTRHRVAWFNGEDLDKETGRQHLAHSICCDSMALMIIKRMNDGTIENKFDDRQNKGTITK